MIIHIAGSGGSGKTTMGNKLKKIYEEKIVVIDTDDIKTNLIKKKYKSVSNIHKALETGEWVEMYLEKMMKLIKRHNDKILILTGSLHVRSKIRKTQITNVVDYKFGIDEEFDKSYKKYAQRKFLDINSKLTKKIIDKTIKQKPDEIFTYLNYVERIPNTPMPYSFYIKLNTLIRKQNTKYGYTYHKSNLLMKKIVKLIDSV
jgi:adenylate kinase family enzyme